MTSEELAKVIADRNIVSVDEKHFTAKEVAEYLILLANHTIVCSNGDVNRALKELFS